MTAPRRSIRPGHHFIHAASPARFEDAGAVADLNAAEEEPCQQGASLQELRQVLRNESRRRDPFEEGHGVENGGHLAAVLADVAGDSVKKESGPGHDGPARRQDPGLLDEDLGRTGRHDTGKRPALERDEPFARSGGKQHGPGPHSEKLPVAVRYQKLVPGLDAQHLGAGSDIDRGLREGVDQVEPPALEKFRPAGAGPTPAAQVLPAQAQVVVQDQDPDPVTAQHPGRGGPGEPATDDGDIDASIVHR